jgi:hypothetical protein
MTQVPRARRGCDLASCRVWLDSTWQHDPHAIARNDQRSASSVEGGTHRVPRASRRPKRRTCRRGSGPGTRGRSGRRVARDGQPLAGLAGGGRVLRALSGGHRLALRRPARLDRSHWCGWGAVDRRLHRPRHARSGCRHRPSGEVGGRSAVKLDVRPHHRRRETARPGRPAADRHADLQHGARAHPRRRGRDRRTPLATGGGQGVVGLRALGAARLTAVQPVVPVTTLSRRGDPAPRGALGVATARTPPLAGRAGKRRRLATRAAARRRR